MNQFNRYKRSTAATLERRAQENPQDAETRFFLGLKLSEENDFHRAAEAFSVALDLDPDHGSAAFYLVEALLKMSKDAEAKEVLLKPYYWGENLSKRFQYLAEIAQREGKLEQARDYYYNALDLGMQLDPAFHLGLTSLLEAGVWMSIPDAKRALIDERVSVTNGVHEVHARVRVFENCCEEGKFIVLLTSEAQEDARGQYGLGVTNGAELLLCFMLNNWHHQFPPESVTWVLMHEATAAGLPPMHISRVDFAVFEVENEETWLQKVLRKFAKLPPETTLQVGEVRFLEISHEELEDLTSHRFFWT